MNDGSLNDGAEERAWCFITKRKLRKELHGNTMQCKYSLSMVVLQLTVLYLFASLC